MSPTLVLLRLLAVLVVPLLVAPSIVTVGSRPTPAVRPAALALAVADQAAALADPLAPATIPAVRPTPAADAVSARAPAAPASPEQADAPVEPLADAAAVQGEQKQGKPASAEGAARATAATAPAQPTGETAAEAEAAPDAKAADEQAKGKKVADAAPDTPEQAGRGRAPAAAAASPSGAPRSLYLAVGHGRAPNGRWQPGAEHPRTGAFEVDAAQIMVDAMVEVLRDAPNLELHVESGDHPNMIGSVARANALGVDDCVEVHQDTAAAPPGAFGHWFAGATAANRLADRLVGAIADQGVPVRHDWHRARSGLYWVRKSECRSVLMEVGRVGDFNPDQLAQLGRAMAEAYLADTAEVRGAS